MASFFIPMKMKTKFFLMYLSFFWIVLVLVGGLILFMSQIVLSKEAGDNLVLGWFFIVGWSVSTISFYTVFIVPIDDSEHGLLTKMFWLVLNYALTAPLFALMLINYDKTGSYKPDWLDILG
jgi:hypothetical protein